MRRMRWFLGSLVILLIGGIASLSRDIYSFYQPIRTTERVFVVAPHVSAKTLVYEWSLKHWVSSPRLLLWIIRLRHASLQLKAGTYRIDESLSVMTLLQQITKGKVLTETFRITEGATIWQVVHQLQQAPYLVYQEADWEGLQQNHLSAEGALLADTYVYDAGSSAKTLLQRAHLQLQHDLDLIWQQREPTLPYHSAYELLIVASILEKESALPAERRLISGIIINRLNKRMPLQMDPTVLYALGPFHKQALTHRDLSFSSPYNSYLHRGLPPTPIAMVGHDALEAAAHPTLSNYLYFVAKGDGTHQFSTTYEAQRRAIDTFLRHKEKLL